MVDYLSLPNLTDAEKEVLRSYKAADDTQSGESKCFDLNKELRNGLRVDDLNKDLREIAEGLDAVFSRCPVLRSEVTVFRGVGERRCHPVHEEGNRFRSLQYWSTTLEESATESFLTTSCRPGYGAVFEIRLPAGFPAYNMEFGGFGGHERELLLPRDILWRVEAFRMRETPKGLADYFKNIAHVVLIPEKWSQQFNPFPILPVVEI